MADVTSSVLDQNWRPEPGPEPTAIEHSKDPRFCLTEISVLMLVVGVVFVSGGLWLAILAVL